MYGSSPGIFRSLKAARMAAEAYTEEENERWIVGVKDAFDNDLYFRPCNQRDIKEALKDGYEFLHKSLK
jgi:hypothetical protein